jgi:hypothetical protein
MELGKKVDMLTGRLVNPEARHLTKEETTEAFSRLNRSDIFPQIIRSTNDPQILGQKIALFSFTPSRKAKPDEHGIYGIAKIRGVCSNEDEANAKAEELIKIVDSCNEIFHVPVGQIFPITTESTFSNEIEQIEVNKRVNAIEKQEERQRQVERQKDAKTILQREQDLMRENKEILDGTYEEDNLDQYIMLRVKKAQLVWTYIDTRRKLEEEVKKSIIKVREELDAYDKKHPEYINQYYERYTEARRSAGITDKLDHSNFMGYLIEDGDLGF